jgi:hypothetical protein
VPASLGGRTVVHGVAGTGGAVEPPHPVPARPCGRGRVKEILVGGSGATSHCSRRCKKGRASAWEDGAPRLYPK